MTTMNIKLYEVEGEDNIELSSPLLEKSNYILSTLHMIIDELKELRNYVWVSIHFPELEIEFPSFGLSNNKYSPIMILDKLDKPFAEIIDKIEVKQIVKEGRFIYKEAVMNIHLKEDAINFYNLCNLLDEGD